MDSDPDLDLCSSLDFDLDLAILLTNLVLLFMYFIVYN